MIRYLLLICIGFGVLSASAQSQDTTAKAAPKVVQLSGVVMVSDSLYPAPFVGIFRARDYRGTYSDINGYFTLPVEEGDTLQFKCTGLKNSYFIVPSGNSGHQMSIVQLMQTDTVELPTAYILPFPAPQDLRREILAMDLPGDNYMAFNRESTSLNDLDGMADFSDRAYNQATSTLDARYNNGFQSGGNILSKEAWSQFIRSSRRAAKKPN
ncbi:MAG: hypothetical protein ACOYLH_02845 [Flavobacteriales bacterium]